MDPFLQNCGISGLEVSVDREGAGGVTVHRFPDRPFVLVGRDPRNDLCLDDERVSKRHAYLQAVGGRLFCADLGSRTGVHGPSGPRASGWVEWDEPLRVGGAVIRVARPGAPPSGGDLGPALPAGRVLFELRGGPAGVVTWAMNRPLALVGAAGGCKVRLRDPVVSRFHCCLVRGPLGVWVVDLLSRVGTRVNGGLVSCARLGEGDEVQVGPYVLRPLVEPPHDLRVMHLPAAAAAGRALLAGPTTYGPPASLDRALLLPVINEFNQMQQQMLDQFHQTMLMMAEMFTTLHKEQAGLVREELDQLRRVTRELNALQVEQARQAAAGRVLAPPNGAAELATAEEDRPQVEEVLGASEKDWEPAKAATAGVAGEKAPDSPEEPAQKSAAAAAAPADVHDWLARRIDQLQAERQGRWQKLVRLVTGR